MIRASMLNIFFPSKNKKLVKKWTKEHKIIVQLATTVIESYTAGDHKACKKALKSLNSLAVDHVMNEDIEFYRLLKKEGALDIHTVDMVHTFTRTFQGTKVTLMNFLNKYAMPKTALDDEFIESFKGLVAVLGERIAYEEKNLYSRLSA